MGKNFIRLLQIILLFSLIVSNSHIFILSVTAEDLNLDNHNEQTYLMEKWSVKNSGKIISQPIMDQYNNLYVASDDGYFHSINSEGKINWSVKINLVKDYSDNYSIITKIGDDEIIYLVSGGFLYAITLDGNIKWEFETSSAVFESLIIGNGNDIIYLLTSLGKLYGIKKDGTKSFEKDNIDWIVSSKKGDMIVGTHKEEWKYINNSNKINAKITSYVKKINNSGNFKWSFTLNNYSVYNTPIIDDNDILYISAKDSSNNNTENNNAISSNNSIKSKLFAIKIRGSQKWSKEIKGKIEMSTFDNTNQTLYFSTSNGTLYSINSIGKENWKYSLNDKQNAYWGNPSVYLNNEGNIYIHDSIVLENDDRTVETLSSKIIILDKEGNSIKNYAKENISSYFLYDNKVYIITFNKILVLDQIDLSLKHEYVLETMFNPIIASDGTIFLVKQTGELAALIEKNEATNDPINISIVQISLSPGSDRKLTVIGYFTDQTSKELSTDITFTSSDNDIIKVDLNGIVTGITPGKAVITVSYNGLTSSAIIEVDGDEADLEKDTQKISFKQKWVLDFENEGRLSSPVSDSNGSIYLTTSKGKLYAIDKNGNKKWDYDTKNYIYTTPLINSNGNITIATNNGKLYTLNPDGEVLWSNSKFKVVNHNPISGKDNTIFISSNPDGKGGSSKSGILYAINPENGNIIWQTAVEGTIVSELVLSNDLDTIYVIVGKSKTGKEVNLKTDGKIFAYSTSEGKKLWSYDLESSDIYLKPIVSEQGDIYIASSEGKLYAVKTDGTKKWTYLAKDSINTNPHIGNDDNLYLAVKSKLLSLSEEGKVNWDIDVGKHIKTIGQYNDSIMLLLAQFNVKENVSYEDNNINFVALNRAKKWETGIIGENISTPLYLNDKEIYITSSGSIPQLLAYEADELDNSKNNEAQSETDSDIRAHWAENAIKRLISLNIVDGYKDGTFKPNQKVTREQFIKMLVQTMGYSLINKNSPSFHDVDNTRWSYAFIETAVEKGIINKDDYSEHFKPDGVIPRYEMAIMVALALNLSENEEEIMKLTDYEEFSQHKGLIGAVIQAEIIKGYIDSTFKPNNLVTRAEAAVVISRIIDYRSN